MADGLLGWPGFGPGGSQQWKAQRLNTGDVWYAPRSGWYFFTGAGGGGGGGNTGGYNGGGGSGGTLFFFPLYVPEGAGGVATIGGGGAVGASGTNTSLGSSLVLGGGLPGGNGTGGASGSISGSLITLSGSSVASQGGAGQPADATSPYGVGGFGGFKSANLTSSLVDDINRGRLIMAAGGYELAAAESCGAGGSGYGTYNSGANGGLIIAWVGSL